MENNYFKCTNESYKFIKTLLFGLIHSFIGIYFLNIKRFKKKKNTVSRSNVKFTLRYTVSIQIGRLKCHPWNKTCPRHRAY